MRGDKSLHVSYGGASAQLGRATWLGLHGGDALFAIDRVVASGSTLGGVSFPVQLPSATGVNPSRMCVTTTVTAASISSCPRRFDPELGFGYDYTVTNTEALLERAFVKDGRIAFAPDQKGAAVLVLSPGREILPEVLLKFANVSSVMGLA
jgi:hypothetical protein